MNSRVDCLSDLGAEVLRIEPPEGSPARGMHPMTGGQSLFFTVRNAGKLGVVLNLSQDPDRDRLHELLACSDVVIDSAEPGAWADSGLDADDLAARHPHLIVCSITSYGRTGPYAGRDVPCAVLDATGGMAFKAGVPAREPLLPPGNIADDTASMHAVFAIECAPHPATRHRCRAGTRRLGQRGHRPDRGLVTVELDPFARRRYAQPR